MTPLAAGAEIRWDSFETAFGRVYAAVSEQGLCQLTRNVAGDDAFEDELALTYRGRRVRHDPKALAEVRSQVRDYFAGRRRSFDLALDLSGLSEFERAVLRATRRVPFGGTASYSELARRLKRPRAARAVGNALRRNPVPIVVPCHRIVRADGSPGGYGGPQGTAEKIRLLDFESGR